MLPMLALQAEINRQAGAIAYTSTVCRRNSASSSETPYARGASHALCHCPLEYPRRHAWEADGNVSGGSGGEPAGAMQHSRSNSLGPGIALAPVTEHGELARADVLLWMPRRLGDTLEHLAGVVDASEMAEFTRKEWACSWASSSRSATSTVCREENRARRNH
jgi:hypothetical protein